jgi:hypothetical protein
MAASILKSRPIDSKQPDTCIWNKVVPDLGVSMDSFTSAWRWNWLSNTVYIWVPQRCNKSVSVYFLIFSELEVKCIFCKCDKPWLPPVYWISFKCHICHKKKLFSGSHSYGKQWLLESKNKRWIYDLFKCLCINMIGTSFGEYHTF